MEHAHNPALEQAPNVLAAIGVNVAINVPLNSRKAASAMIAKIPFPLGKHIAQVFKGVRELSI